MVELLLGLKHSLQLLVRLLLLALVLALEDLVLSFGLGSVPLHDVVIVMGAFECRLHAGQLVLDSIELHTGLFSRLSDLPYGLLSLAELEVDTFVLVCELLGQSVLQARHQGL